MVGLRKHQGEKNSVVGANTTMRKDATSDGRTTYNNCKDDNNKISIRGLRQQLDTPCKSWCHISNLLQLCVWLHVGGWCPPCMTQITKLLSPARLTFWWSLTHPEAYLWAPEALSAPDYHWDVITVGTNYNTHTHTLLNHSRMTWINTGLPC